MLRYLSIKKTWDFEKTIAEIYQPKSNAFDVLRFIMATLVIIHHSYDLLARRNTNFFVQFTKGQLNLGEFAVGSFFIISGFLVAQSLINSKNLIEYFLKRFLRLFPALFASLFLSAMVLGPFITSQGFSEYFFGNEGTNPFQFIFLNFTLNIFGFNYNIRDLFALNPFPYAVNGSLWTLKHEFASYVTLAVLFYFGLFKHPRLLLAFTCLVGGSYIAYEVFDINLVSKVTTVWWVFHAVEYPYFLKLLWLFLSGTILYVFRERIFISTKMLILISGFLLTSIKLGYLHQTWYFAFSYLLIGFAILLPLSWFSKYGDFSYGIYIYAFPVQQTLIFALYPNIGVHRLMAYSFVVTLMLSIFSWHLIEKPALNLKKRLGWR